MKTNRNLTIGVADATVFHALERYLHAGVGPDGIAWDEYDLHLDDSEFDGYIASIYHNGERIRSWAADTREELADIIT